MRITLDMLTDRVRTHLLESSERLLKAQDRASSGKRIQRPSDDVVGTGRSLQFRSALKSIEQFDRNANFASNQLSVISSTLDSIVSAVQNVRSLALRGANSIITDESRAALAAQLDQTISQIADLVNTQYAGKYIFGGKITNQPPIVKNPAGSPPYLYQGDSGQLKIRIGPSLYVDASVRGDVVLNIDGASAPSSPDLFQTIQTIRDKILAADVNGISQEIVNVDSVLANIVALRSQVGGRVSRLDSTIQALSESKTRVQELLSKTEDVDLAEAIVELRMRENVYQAAVTVANRVLNISLFNSSTY